MRVCAASETAPQRVYPERTAINWKISHKDLESVGLCLPDPRDGHLPFDIGVLLPSTLMTLRHCHCTRPNFYAEHTNESMV